MTLLTELYDIARFSSLASYTGLVPGITSSGETEYTKGITYRRNPILRGVLIEAFWAAVRKDPALMMAFHRFPLRMKKTAAMVHVASKLLNRIRFVLINQERYVSAVV